MMEKKGRGKVQLFRENRPRSGTMALVPQRMGEERIKERTAKKRKSTDKRLHERKRIAANMLARDLLNATGKRTKRKKND